MNNIRMENSHGLAETMRIMKNIATSRFDYVRFTFVDFHGIARSKTVPKARIKQFFQEGCSFFAGAIGLSLVGPMVPKDIPDIKNTNSGNVFACPQPGTLHVLPLNGGPCRMGEVLCETYFPNGTVQEANPRTIARKQLENLKKLGYELFSSWELETTFLDEQALKPNFKRSIMAFTNIAFDAVEEMMLYSDKTFCEMGIDLETLQTEASPGQYEFVTKPIKGIRQADNMILMKDTIRKVAKRYNRKAVFMTKIFPQAGYSAAMHFNHSLLSANGHNILGNETDLYKLSAVCRHWIAGILKHSPALTALCCPTVNCYRRLHVSIAPDKANWGIDARLACCRIKNYSSESTYIEFRLPSGSANPYLVMAATVAAGIDGLNNKYELPPPVGNYTLNPRKASEVIMKDVTKPAEPVNCDKVSEPADKNEEPDAKRTRLEDNSSNDSGDNPPKTENDETTPVEKSTTASKEEPAQEGSNITSTTGENGFPTEAADLPHSLEEALTALENDKYIVEALGENFVNWFVAIKRNEIEHFKSFTNITDEELLLKECECYMDLL